jgi:RimJ/RimL family protein N-acetyltransferase
MQAKFYDDTICNRNAKARYWAVWRYDAFIGMVGLENIEFENGLAEISIILNPEYHGRGYGKEAVDMLLRRGFGDMHLENIYGECYVCNLAYSFWQKICEKYGGTYTHLPNRKYYNGTFYDSLYFSINKEGFYGADNT